MAYFKSEIVTDNNNYIGLSPLATMTFDLSGIRDNVDISRVSELALVMELEYEKAFAPMSWIPGCQ
jgi:hypothetical protein